MSDEHSQTEATQARPTAADRSLTGLLGDLLRDVPQLLRQELRLLRGEVGQALAHTDAAVGRLLFGAVFAAAGFILLLQAMAQALERWLEPWVAEALVGGVVLLIGFAAVQAGRHRLRAAGRVPERTSRQVRRDVDLVRDHTS